MLKNKLNTLPVSSNALHRAKREYLQSQHNRYTEIKVTSHLAQQFRGDFYGLLIELNQPMNTLLLTLELNNLDSSAKYDGFTNVLIINENLIPKLNAIKISV